MIPLYDEAKRTGARHDTRRGGYGTWKESEYGGLETGAKLPMADDGGDSGTTFTH
jgi:hypothetical protein